MSFTPRPYQVDAIRAGVEFFKNRHPKKEKRKNGLIILPTGSGKSVVIANICKDLYGKTIVFQPSKEILQQNYAKFSAYGFRAGIYSASAGHKFIEKITFATIGSVIRKKHLFADVEHIIIDECHLVNAEAGMYLEFINSIGDSMALGLTATPYRLSSGKEGAMLKFLTRTRPRVFKKVLYFVQNNALFNAGHLAPLRYFSFDVINRQMLQTNSTGTDFTDASLKSYYRQINMPKITTAYANRLLLKRRNLLVFCALIEEAEKVVAGIPGALLVTGDTEASERDKILRDFKSGKVRCVVNVGVLTTGFDYPELECVLIARSTMSLSLYYQIIGRCMRPFRYPDGSLKEGWVVDLGGNITFFGKIETMEIVEPKPGLHYIMNNGRCLTNVPFTK